VREERRGAGGDPDVAIAPHPAVDRERRRSLKRGGGRGEGEEAMSKMEDTREERLSREKTPEAKEEKESSSSEEETDEEEETEEYLERLSVAKRRARSEIKLSEWDKCAFPPPPSLPSSLPPLLHLPASLPPSRRMKNNDKQSPPKLDETRRRRRMG
jgi:hypothetical protein